MNATEAREATIGGRRFDWRRVHVMGIVNVTPDSFSGDGLGDDVEAAVAQGLRMAAEGAALLDVGGESTRPGHRPVDAEEERRRVLPVVERLVAESGVPVSIDTTKPEVAAAALEAGAAVVNDVWGLAREPGLARLAAGAGAAVVVMHNREHTNYDDLVGEVLAGLRSGLEVALAAGVPRERVILDPGIGFGKTPEQNVLVMRRLEQVVALGAPVLLGASRKSWLGRVFGQEPGERLEGSLAAAVAGVLRGAAIVRVHDVAATVRAVRVAEGLR